MFSGDEVAELIAELGVTHVIWLPDSGLGPWETVLENSSAFRLLRVAREGEAGGSPPACTSAASSRWS